MEPLSEAQQLLARLKERSEQSRTAAGRSPALADLSFNAPSSALPAGGASASSRPSSAAPVGARPTDLAPLPAEEQEEGEPDATTITNVSKIVLRGEGGKFYQARRRPVYHCFGVGYRCSTRRG